MGEKSSKNVTISDIAQAVGVSRTTVSRYINGRYDLMSPDTRARIEAAIRMTNYHPNSIAQSLRANRSMQIGVVVSDISSPFCATMVRAIGRALLDTGYVSLFVDCEEDPDREFHLIQTLLSRKVDGLIVHTSNYVNPRLIQTACDGVPMVLCDRNVQDYRFPFVGFQHRQAMAAMMAHLKQEGFAKVAFFTQEYHSIYPRFVRHDAYLEGIRTHYPQEDGEALTYILDLRDYRHTEECIRHLLSTCEPGQVPAIFAVNTVTSTHVLSVMDAMGLSAPGDLGLCGPDDWGWDSEYSLSIMQTSKLSAINLSPASLGGLAVQTLLQRIQEPDGEKPEILLPMTTTIRASTMLRQWQQAHGG